MMSQKIVFFNHFHNGDLHVSRGIIRHIINKVHQIDSNVNFVYTHPHSRDVLADIPKLEFDSQAILELNDAHVNLNEINGDIYINTWYGQQKWKYMNRYGLTMDCLYMALNDSCQNLWGFSLSESTEDFSVFFPTIDYSKYQIAHIKNWLPSHPEKKVFVSNGLAMSGQATNFEMTPIIVELAQNHSDKIFILSNKESNMPLPSNVIYSSDIINKQSFDLNENSFLSTHCDVIIGRSSGASTFAMTQENLFQKKKKILLFTNIVPHPTNKFWADEIFKNKINYSSDIVCVDISNKNDVFDLINTTIE